MTLIKEHLLRIKDATLRAVDPKPAVKRFSELTKTVRFASDNAPGHSMKARASS